MTSSSSHIHPPISIKQKEVSHIDETPRKRGRPKKEKTDSDNPLPLQRSVPELEEWDPRELPNGFFLVLEGKRRTGKSTFAKWLLQWYQDKFSLVWVMSQTSVSGYWQPFVGNQFVFEGWRPGAVEKLIERNKAIVSQYGEDSPVSLAIGSALIILDDCITKEIFYSDIFTRLAVEGRHHLIAVLYITQDPKTVCPKVRDNADVAVVFNQKTFRNKESIWHDFMNDVDKQTAFALLANYAIEHDALVCVQTNLNGKIERNFKKSTGDKTKLKDPNYMLGGPTQKEQIKKERAESKEYSKIKKLQEAADKRPMKEKGPHGSKAECFSKEAMEKGGVSRFFSTLDS